MGLKIIVQVIVVVEEFSKRKKGPLVLNAASELIRGLGFRPKNDTDLYKSNFSRVLG